MSSSITSRSVSRTLRRVIKEELKNIKVDKNKLLEFFTASRVTPGFEIEDPWDETWREKIFTTTLKGIAKPISNGINPHGYELDLLVEKPGSPSKQDRLWFNHNGTVWSTNQTRDLYYRVNGSKIDLYTTKEGRNTKDETTFTGSISKRGNQAVFNLQTIDAAEEPNRASDIGHTVLDVVGFIPGIGDIADVINAAWYFYERKWLEGLLSVIAVIPVVGSVISVPIKAAVRTIFKGRLATKLTEAVKYSFKTKNTHELWNMLVQHGAVTRDQLKDIGPGLDGLSELLKSNRKSMPDWAVKQVDDLTRWMDDSVKQIDELSTSMVKGSDKISKAGKTVNKVVSSTTDVVTNNVARVVNTLSPVQVNGLFKRLRRLGQFPEKKLLALSTAMQTRFVKQMGTPDKLSAIIKLTSNPRKVMNDISDVIQKLPPNSPAVSKFNSIFSANTRSSNILHKVPMREYQNFFNAIKRQDPEAFTRITNVIGEHAIATNSPAWSLYRSNSMKALTTTLSMKHMKNQLGLVGDNTMRKWADIIYNELHDMGEDLGNESVVQDNPTAIVYPVIKAGIEATLPGTSASIQSYRDAVVKNPAVSAALTVFGYNTTADGQIIDSGELQYDPYKEAGGKYQ
jgi:hypothetical protein